jgi:ribose transport system substrate-binding protein
MSRNHKNSKAGIDRRFALKSLVVTAILWSASAGVWMSSNLGGWVEEASATTLPTPTIPVIVKDTSSLYWQIVHGGARKAGQDLGVNVTELGPPSELDIAGQMRILENSIASKPAAIVIAPVEFATLGSAIAKAAKNLKIIGMESTAESKAFTSFVTIDNEEAGRMAADALADAIKRTYADTEGDVALITSPPGNASLDARVKAFKAQIATKYGALNIVSEKAGDAMKATGYKIMRDLINEYPELRGVFAADRSIAQGAAQAVAENMTNKTGDKINLVGFGMDDTLAKSLQDGTLAALIVQNPFRMGYDSVKAALAASRGEPVPLELTVGAELITKANLNSARVQDLKPSNK